MASLRVAPSDNVIWEKKLTNKEMTPKNGTKSVVTLNIVKKKFKFIK
jgi:hypothetical protein